MLHGDQLDVIPGGTSSEKVFMPDIWAWPKDMESEKICTQKYGSQLLRFFYLFAIGNFENTISSTY